MAYLPVAFQRRLIIGAHVPICALAAVGIPRPVCIGIIAVMVACFAATTLDTATRLQRYVIQELGGALRIAPLTMLGLAFS